MYEKLLNGHVFLKKENVQLKDDKDFVLYWDANIICGYISAKRLAEIVETAPKGDAKENLIQMMQFSMKFKEGFWDALYFTAYTNKGKSLWDYLKEKKFIKC